MPRSLFTRPWYTKLAHAAVMGQHCIQLLDLVQFRSVLPWPRGRLNVKALRAAHVRRRDQPLSAQPTDATGGRTQRETFILMLMSWVNERNSLPRVSHGVKTNRGRHRVRNASAGDR